MGAGAGDLLPQGVRLIRANPEWALPIARRLVSPNNADIDDAAKRLIASANKHGIDLRMAWATAQGPDDAPVVRQTCLPILGSGRTAMIYMSDPPRAGDPGGTESGRLERIAVVNAACSMLEREYASRAVLAQSLPDPQESWAVRALDGAGFLRVGDLSYLRRAPRQGDERLGLAPETPRTRDTPALPVPFRLVCLTDVPTKDRNALLIKAMDTTYTGTLDCPELCGLRATEDILASHQATGVFDASLWWVLLDADRPAGCLMMSACPEQKTYELVYIGLDASARGNGLGRVLMEFGVRECARRERAWTISCAVDQRNTPALRLYDAMGFRAFARRAPFVRQLRAHPHVKSAR
jgi:ribosomal protein S18 acetylase RimI-like enzyme